MQHYFGIAKLPYREKMDTRKLKLAREYKLGQKLLLLTEL